MWCLPASSYFEKNGTFTNGERRVQRVNKVVEPIGNSKADGQIIIDMMYKMGYEQPTGRIYDAPKILTEIADVIPFMNGVTWEGLGKNGLQWPVSKDGTLTLKCSILMVILNAEKESSIILILKRLLNWLNIEKNIPLFLLRRDN